ncbi:DNA polymerase III subunit chi [Pararhodospirillum photometricum]|uniref:DNA polymerase III, chi subunit n=1 Tax=Pararhodospirillum photometricum DSM 122 TaxID=1150469 RepID=H6SKM9_PARPM|nr:DNA polymerase III subunit chi [Pararhodospirillum photometricum]CCG08544.1 DNA polymerase III, chi subunit [Pararhodospirillum photometricum DSM 122]
MTGCRMDFYHLRTLPLEEALPRLLLKATQGGRRAVVRAGSLERVEALDGLLWTFDPASWLPHGAARDGQAARQPIWLTCDEDVPNGACFLFLLDGVWPRTFEGFERSLVLFDGRDDDAVARARSQWREARDLGLALHYWQQTPTGGWEEKAHSPGKQASPPKDFTPEGS